MRSDASERYSRQILFPGIGPDGQARLRQSKALLVGCGALGSLQAEALTRAGIGQLRIVDRDTVDWSNLQRQWLFTERDASDQIPKAIAAERRLRELNRDVALESHVADLTPENAQDLAEGVDLLLDGTDNFETRFLLNDLSVKMGVPWVYGAAVGSYGIVIPIDSKRGPCLRCIYPEGPTSAHPTCDTGGILAATTGAVASLQTAAALRFLAGWPDFSCRMQSLDVWTGSARTLSAGARDNDCPTCIGRRFLFLDGPKRTHDSLCGRNAVQLHPRNRAIDLASLASQLEKQGDVRVNAFALRLSAIDFDLTVFPDGRAIVHGTTDIARARSLYARLIGS